MTPRPLSPASLQRALLAGWRMATATRRVSLLYSLCFVLPGGLILGVLLALGWMPLLLVAGGGFMLVAPVTLAGFFGIARAAEAGAGVGLADVSAGFARAATSLWALALVCGLLLMIFVSDAAILYAYLVGGDPVGLLAMPAGVGNFALWAAASGLIVAFLLYCISAFAVPLLCERRCSLVAAVVLSVRVIFGNFPVAMLWAVLLAGLGITGALLLPLLPVFLPWLAYASRALYREVLPLLVSEVESG